MKTNITYDRIRSISVYPIELSIKFLIMINSIMTNIITIKYWWESISVIFLWNIFNEIFTSNKKLIYLHVLVWLISSDHKYKGGALVYGILFPFKLKLASVGALLYHMLILNIEYLWKILVFNAPTRSLNIW